MKALTYVRPSVKPAQLAEELKQQIGAGLLYIDTASMGGDVEITAHCADNVTEAAVQQVIDAHVPAAPDPMFSAEWDTLTDLQKAKAMRLLWRALREVVKE